MKKFKVSGIFTEYIYADSVEEAIEQFDEITSDFVENEFDEIIYEEIPPIEYSFVPQNA